MRRYGRLANFSMGPVRSGPFAALKRQDPGLSGSFGTRSGHAFPERQFRKEGQALRYVLNGGMAAISMSSVSRTSQPLADRPCRFSTRLRSTSHARNSGGSNPSLTVAFLPPQVTVSMSPSVM